MLLPDGGLGTSVLLLYFCSMGDIIGAGRRVNEKQRLKMYFRTPFSSHIFGKISLKNRAESVPTLECQITATMNPNYKIICILAIHVEKHAIKNLRETHRIFTAQSCVTNIIYPCRTGLSGKGRNDQNGQGYGNSSFVRTRYTTPLAMDREFRMGYGMNKTHRSLHSSKWLCLGRPVTPCTFSRWVI